jgi:hypothetical protein
MKYHEAFPEDGTHCKTQGHCPERERNLLVTSRVCPLGWLRSGGHQQFKEEPLYMRTGFFWLDFVKKGHLSLCAV